MEVGILGPLEVWAGERRIEIGGGKQRALFAILLLHANEVVSTDRLIDELWGEAPPPTALKALQGLVSQLRKVLEPRRDRAAPEGILLTRPPGYMLRLEAGSLDVHRFERLLEEGRRALAGGTPEEASAMLREAVALWRGAPLGDFAFEDFARTAIVRLEELRLLALAERHEADLALGRHADLVGELEALVATYPLRERLRGQLMLALYRSGRQAEALEAYRRARRVLVEELGIEPSPALQELEKSILRQDPSLELGAPARSAPVAAEPEPDLLVPERSILVVPGDAEGLTALLALAEPLAASQPPRELIMARLVAPSKSDDSSAESGELVRATAELRERRAALIARRVAARVAAFTSKAPGEDIVRLASEQQVDLLLVDGRLSALGTDPLSGEIGIVFAGAPCDAALLIERGDRVAVPGSDRPVLVPFGASEHDWAALELGAWIARTHRAPLELLGSAPDVDEGKRDASRLLADASLIIQRLAGIVPEPRLVSPGPEGVASAAEGAGLVVVGLSERWRQDGLGTARAAIARTSPAPVVFVRRGTRPGGLAPPETRTRFRWSAARAATELP